MSVRIIPEEMVDWLNRSPRPFERRSTRPFVLAGILMVAAVGASIGFFVAGVLSQTEALLIWILPTALFLVLARVQQHPGKPSDKKVGRGRNIHRV